jgi:hypothetical protein
VLVPLVLLAPQLVQLFQRELQEQLLSYYQAK